MKKNFKFTLAVISLLVASFAQSSYADKHLPELSAGLSYHEVLKKWGPPVEKEEYETARRDIWVYRGASVTFSSGKVRSWKIGSESSDSVAIAQDTTTNTSSSSDETRAFVVEDLLSEIGKSPAGNDSSENSQAPGINANPQNINPLPVNPLQQNINGLPQMPIINNN